MLKKTSSSFTLFLTILLLLAQVEIRAGETGKIAGKIVDKATRETLIGANVLIVSRIINGSEEPIKNIYGAATDVEGDYFILNIPPGTYNLKASYIGYSEAIITDITVDVDKTTRVNFALNSEAIQSDEVIITGVYVVYSG